MGVCDVVVVDGQTPISRAGGSFQISEDSAEERAQNCKFWRGTFVTFVFCNNLCILSDNNCYHSCTDNSTERPPPHIDHHMCRCSRRRHRCHGCRNAAAVTAATTAVSAAIAAAFWLIVVC